MIKTDLETQNAGLALWCYVEAEKIKAFTIRRTKWKSRNATPPAAHDTFRRLHYRWQQARPCRHFTSWWSSCRCG